jgi:hypothetical protein
MEKKVQQYLQRKGFRLTELALQEERNRISTSSVSDVALARSENDPARYYDGYSKLRTWAYSSLDQYKVCYTYIDWTSPFDLAVHFIVLHNQTSLAKIMSDF